MDYELTNKLDIHYIESKFDDASKDSHYYHEFVLVKGGEAEFTICNKKYIARKGSLVIIGNLENHDFKINNDMVYKRYVLRISHDFCLLNIRELALISILIHRTPDYSHVIQLSEDNEEFITDLFDSITQEYMNKPVMWQMRCSLLISEILLSIYRINRKIRFSYAGSEMTNSIVEVQKYIEENLNRKITLEELGKKYYISKCYLSRMFQEITGYGFKEYLILCKLNKAKMLLCDTNLSVGDISASVGYVDVNNFIRIFRIREGTTPKQFRKISLSDRSTPNSINI